MISVDTLDFVTAPFHFETKDDIYNVCKASNTSPHKCRVIVAHDLRWRTRKGETEGKICG